MIKFILNELNKILKMLESIDLNSTNRQAHNRLYRLGLFRSHTRDCNLEENEKLHRLIAYQILGN